ncbi:replication initiator protein A [Staphylococcus saccharolyticus]|jgi:replication-associated protein repA|uniref:Replication initiator protein n=1 Tax=Staphylococcus saccharolyticus TaxID=33028 RepID=A0A380JAZ2_9STAP|nr:replication initiator protein A [Staphylococcus saccharolyticus]MBL7566117.1 replication initiator protein A [Staphylococcus saccharolyticus]MBL7571675.1 replication initiator protein A [Staphylococcus saccharolyticus]QRJ67554.1 replication initiator protein A [Staphylococcus saccharolyticus]RTX97664.1 replication initiator protein A [Staphylococcus saccharolyticus]TAA98106.1 replication protein [Staphylococcus saccharolyticus]
MSNFNIKEIQKEKFYQLPKVFFTNPKYTNLSNDAKITWSILRDRLDLSIRNNWVDENGDIFFIYTNEKLKSILNISSPNKLSKIKKELAQANLFSQIRVGLNKPNKLYIKKPEVTETDVYYILKQENDVEDRYNKDVSLSYIQKYDNDTSRNINKISHDISKEYNNDTELNNTDHIKTNNNDMNDLNDTSTKTYSNHTNHKNTKFNNDALKFQILEELPNQIKDYLSNFEIREIRIIKSILLKGKKSFNNTHDTYYRLEEVEFEIVSVLKRFKAMLLQKNESVEAMQGYLMQSIKSELEEKHALNMRRQNISKYNIFHEKFK